MGNFFGGLFVGICIVCIVGRIALRREIRELKKRGWLR